MPSYVTKEVKIEDLYLDEVNPRFIIPPNPSQQSIVDYLIENEEVEQLAIDIAKSKGLYAGERVIVTEENKKLVVLEGNRRICACKILLKPSLLSNRRLASIDRVTLLMNEEIKNNLSTIEVDVMPNRLSAQSSLAAKHIDGIKKWSTISKYKFFVLEYDSGKSIEEIAMITGVTSAKIKTGLKEFRIIDYVLKLPFWSEEDRKEYLNLQDIKTSRLIRLFGVKPIDPRGKRLREILDLDYDDNYQIKTSLDKKVFDNILYIVAQAAFIPNYSEKFSGTRSTYEDIPQLMEFLEKNKMILDNKSTERTLLTTTQSTKGEIQKDTDNKKEAPKKEGLNTFSTNYTSKRNVLIPDDFNVICKVVKINNIINELKRLNLNYSVNAQAVLLRVLLELSLKYYLTRANETGKILENNLDGTYVAALESMRMKKLLSNAEHSNLIKIRKTDKVFNVFNGYVHYDSVLPNKDILIYYFDNMRKIIEICLNN